MTGVSFLLGVLTLLFTIGSAVAKRFQDIDPMLYGLGILVGLLFLAVASLSSRLDRIQQLMSTDLNVDPDEKDLRANYKHPLERDQQPARRAPAPARDQPK